MSEGVFQGSLFSSDFLQESISRLPDWSHLDDAALDALQLDLRRIFDRFPTGQTPNGSQKTIRAVLRRQVEGLSRFAPLAFRLTVHSRPSGLFIRATPHRAGYLPTTRAGMTR
jgi:hypothetical protein